MALRCLTFVKLCTVMGLTYRISVFGWIFLPELPQQKALSRKFCIKQLLPKGGLNIKINQSSYQVSTPLWPANPREYEELTFHLSSPN